MDPQQRLEHERLAAAFDRQQQRINLVDSETHWGNYLSFNGDEDAVDLDGTFTKAQLIEIANLVGPAPD